MSAKDVFSHRVGLLSILEEIALSGCVELYSGNDGFVHIKFNPERMPKKLNIVLNELGKMGPSALLEAIVQGFAYHEGFKIVVPSNRLDTEALENTILNFPACEYNQPFPTMFVDLTTQHEVHCPQVGEIYFGEVLPPKHYPHTIGLRHVRTETVNYIIASIYFTSHQVITFLLDCTEKSGTLEESITASKGGVTAISISDEEYAVCISAMRIALNTVLILEGEGLRTLGPGNVKYFKKLEENVQKAKRRRDPLEKIQRAEQILRQEPIYYTFEQNTVFYHRSEAETVDAGPGTGRTIRPHWRSGFHRMQHYGPGNILRKRVRIPAVFVNKHRFLGLPKDTVRTTEVR